MEAGAGAGAGARAGARAVAGIGAEAGIGAGAVAGAVAEAAAESRGGGTTTSMRAMAAVVQAVSVPSDVARGADVTNPRTFFTGPGNPAVAGTIGAVRGTGGGLVSERWEGAEVERVIGGEGGKVGGRSGERAKERGVRATFWGGGAVRGCGLGRTHTWSPGGGRWSAE